MISNPYKLNPYKVLNIQCKKDARKNFIWLLRGSNEEQKPILCLAFDMICNESKYNVSNGIYTPKIKDEFYYTNIGDLNGLKNLIDVKNKKKLNVDDSLNRTILYLASRNGYFHIVDYLINIGTDLNKVQNSGSTPLHGAAYYGHESIVKILLENGCSPYIKNQYGNLAESEAYKGSIKSLITNSYNNKILNLYHILYSERKVSNFIPIKNKKDGKTICYKLICKNEFNTQQKNDYVVAWHGTKFKNLKSIVMKGLKPSGAKISDKSIILPAEYHIPLNVALDGIDNWANAVFVSPNFNYSGLYSEIISCDNQKWACLIEVRVKNGEFSKHRATMKCNIPSNSSLLEFRVDMNEYDSSDILYVTSVVFLSKDYLDKARIKKVYEDTDICETEEESNRI